MSTTTDSEDIKEALEANYLELYKEAVKAKEFPETVEEAEEEEDPSATVHRDNAGEIAQNEVVEKED